MEERIVEEWVLYRCVETLCETFLVNQDTRVYSPQIGNTWQPKDPIQVQLDEPWDLLKLWTICVIYCETYLCVCVCICVCII